MQVPADPAEYGEFIPTCRQYGINRTAAYELARDGLLETFHIGTKRFIWRESLRTLPLRLAERARKVAA